jgi:hydroxymethylglutaryl-CoA lyase
VIHITEVGPRDGLQNERHLLTVEQKVDMLRRLIRAGIRKIEAVSFVNPKMVPQMAGAEEVLSEAPRDGDVIYAGLVLSRSGLERAMKTRVDVIHFAMAASDTFNYRNARRTTQQSLDEITEMISELAAARKPMVGYVATAFGCPFEGMVPLDTILRVADRFLDAGCTEIVLADTVGMANPRQVIEYVQALFERFGRETKLGLHFHNTRGLGLANVFAGYTAGVRRFDSSIGGLGGCPFAPKAVGNVCTEDMVNMFEQMGEQTGAKLDVLIETAQWMEKCVGRRLDGMVMKAHMCTT